MILKFKVKNYKSFKKPATLSLVTTSKIRDISNHESKIGPLSVLKYASVYGANAVGKSNLISSLESLKNLVVIGDFSDIKPFKESNSNTILYEIIYEKNGHVFQYSLTVNVPLKNKRIIIEKESLFLVDLVKNKISIIFDEQGINVDRLDSNEENAYLERRYFENCRANPDNIFLNYFTNKENRIDGSKAQELIREAFSFFINDLVFVTNNIDGFSEVNDATIKNISKKLEQYDTGIKGVRFEKCSSDEINQTIPKTILRKINERFDSVKNDKKINLTASLTNGLTIYNFKEAKDGSVVVSKIVGDHDGFDSPFDFNEESDGTKRLVLLCALLFGGSNKDKVFLFDEFEKSLHPLLAKEIINDYMEANKDNNSQFIVTSHLPLLMDTSFRKDEIFILDKMSDGGSLLYPLVSFGDIRSDTKINKNYLLGKYGGIPTIDKEI